MQNWRDVGLPVGYKESLQKKTKQQLIRHAMLKELNHRKANAYVKEILGRLKTKAADYERHFAAEHNSMRITENERKRIATAIDIIAHTLGADKDASVHRWAVRGADMLIDMLSEHAMCMKKISQGIGDISLVLNNSLVPEKVLKKEHE